MYISSSTGHERARGGGGRVARREREREREGAVHQDLFILISPTVISAKLKLPKEVSFASPGLPLPHFPFFSYLSRTSLWFGVLLVPATSLPPANQPTKQPRASLMLLLRISGRLLGCQPAGTIGRCVSPPFLPFFFLPPSFPLSSTPFFRPSSFTPSCLHFILRHALSLSFSFPRDSSPCS